MRRCADLNRRRYCAPRVAFLNRLEILHPAPGERVRIPQWMGERLNEVETSLRGDFPARSARP